MKPKSSLIIDGDEFCELMVRLEALMILHEHTFKHERILVREGGVNCPCVCTCGTTLSRICRCDRGGCIHWRHLRMVRFFEKGHKYLAEEYTGFNSAGASIVKVRKSSLE